MKIVAITLLAVLTAALAACDLKSTISAPGALALASVASTDTLPQPHGYDRVCKNGLESMPATKVGNRPIDASRIMTNCPYETCTTLTVGSSPVVTVDPDGIADRLTVTCPDASIRSITSAAGCWDCVDGCSASCPTGSLCKAFPEWGNDCQEFTCPEGWNLTDPDGNPFKAPYCTRPCPPPLTVTISGPIKIKPGATCTWTASASGGSGGPYTFAWYNDNHVQNTGDSYTGGRLSGTLYPQFWVRVDVADADGTHHKTTQILVKEDATAAICPTNGI